MEQKFTVSSVLDNLTDKANKGELKEVIGRDEEVQNTIEILNQLYQNNVCLIGFPGVGKTSVVNALANRIANPDEEMGLLPESLRKANIWSLNVSKLKGASAFGQLEQNMMEVVEYIKSKQADYYSDLKNPNVKKEDRRGQVILFIDEIQDTFPKDNSGAEVSLLEALKTDLAEGTFKIIGATTPDAYDQTIGADPALDRRFQTVRVKEPTIEEAINILRGKKRELEKRQKVKIMDSALVSAVKMSDRYIKDKYLPAKAVTILDRAISSVVTERDSKPKTLIQTEREIALKQNEINSIEREKDSNPITAKRYEKLVKEVTVLKEQKEVLFNNWNIDKQILLEADGYRSLYEDIELAIDELAKHTENETANTFASVLINSVEEPVRKAMEKRAKRLENISSIKQKVSDSEIAEQVTKITEIPVQKLDETQMEKAKELPNQLKAVVKGQDRVVEYISNVIQVSKIGIQDPNRPIASFMFLGTTGVGKTELAKALTQALLGNTKMLLKYDMSEYKDETSINKLIGASAGYVGYSEGGKLTNDVMKHPYSIVLFDEIEKADKRIFDILLQVLDEGRLTDNHGRTVDFKNTIIIMTSNLGADLLKAVAPGKQDTIKDQELKKMLHDNGYRDEFINRIDKILAFNTLSDDAYDGIIKKHLSASESRVLKETNYIIRYDQESLVPYIRNQHTQEERIDNGARDVRSFIQGVIEKLVSNAIIYKGIPVDTPYVVKVQDKEIVLVPDKDVKLDK